MINEIIEGKIYFLFVCFNHALKEIILWQMYLSLSMEFLFLLLFYCTSQIYEHFLVITSFLLTEMWFIF